ncbi:S-adenosyl-L-methionine-dependent methyltransferase [Cryomyces antarcticus]
MPPEQTQEAPSARENSTASSLGLAAALLTLAAVSSPISQLSLSPVYGSIPASQFHQKAITATALLAFVGKTTLRKHFSLDSRTLLPVLAFCIPTVQLFLFKCSTQLGPAYGPLITEGLTFLPLLLLSFYCAGAALEAVNLGDWLNPTVAELAPAVVSYFSFSAIERAASTYLPHVDGDVFTRTILQLLVASAHAVLCPSWLCLLALPALIHTLYLNPHFPTTHSTNLLNSTLHQHGWSLLERTESVTGYVSVLENLDDQFRVLRCDHSILGGEWLVTPERRRQGITVREPIYAVFEMLEAVRLVVVEGDGRTDGEKSALVIGLGIGTAPRALLAHSISTTTLELDPSIAYFATKYFDLPASGRGVNGAVHTAFITDAAAWVRDASAGKNADAAKQTEASGAEVFDYIVHDVFTGGAEPLALFTTSFLTDLRALLSEHGVVAINYAGDLALPSTRLVLDTIYTVFGSCRMFRDNPPLDADYDSASDYTSNSKTRTAPAAPHGKSGRSRAKRTQERRGAGDAPPTDFLNLVLFCRKDARPVTFRAPLDADYLGSASRRQFLVPRAELELAFPLPLPPPDDATGDAARDGREASKEGRALGAAGRPVLTTANTAHSGAQQVESAGRHWRIMRRVVPAVVWESW